MEVIAIEPRDVHIVLDISLMELNHLLNVLNASEIDSAKCDKESIDYIKNKFFPDLDKLYLKLAEEQINGSGLDSKRS